MAQFYPERASHMGISGSAAVECQVNPNGTLDDCSIVSETPPDQEFGSAALKLARFYKMKPTSRDGVPTAGSKIILQIGFQLPH